jgi:hypothetical protein
MGAEAFDGGGREVVGWLHCHRWRAIIGWLPLIVERNMLGCLPYNTNPEPWPDFWWATENAEISHLGSPWYWGEIQETAALVALSRTLRDVYRVYPQVTPQQIHDVLTQAGVL